MNTPTDGDSEMDFTAWEIAQAGDPGHLGEDEPEVRTLCRNCVLELPDSDDGLCTFCRAVLS